MITGFNTSKRFCVKAVLLALSLILCAPAFSYARMRANGEVHTAKRTARVNFRVNRTVIEPEYMGNKSQFMMLDSIFRYVPSEIVDSIVIFSLASPEGKYRHNIDLARGREAAFKAFIAKRYPEFPIDKVISRGGGEAWAQLIEAVEADPKLSRKVKNKVREIATMPGPSQNRKVAMKKLPEYKYIHDNIYPNLRYTAVAGWVSVMPEMVEMPELEQLNAKMQAAVIHPDMTIYPWKPFIISEFEENLPQGRIHALALRTNMLYDLAYMPGFGFAPMWDIQAEYYPRKGHWTGNVQFTSPYWQKWDEHKFFQFRDYRLEARRYFRESANYTGFYAGLYANANKFGIGITGTDGVEGEGAGGGLQAGYVLPLNKKGNLRLEFNIGLGAYVARFDPYTWGNPVTGTIDGQYYYNFLGSADKFIPRNHRFTWFGPTAAGVSLTYDILYRKAKEGGR